MARLLTTLAVVSVLAAAGLAPYAVEQGFAVDASTDSLVLEDDPDSLRYDRTRLLFASDEFVLVALTRPDLFTPDGVAAVASLHDRFERIQGLDGKKGVEDVLSLKSAQLLRSWPKRPSMPRPGTVLSPGIDLEKAKDELIGHELYRGNIISADGKTAGIVVTLVARQESLDATRTWTLRLAARGRAREGVAAVATASAAEQRAAKEALAKAQAELDAFRPTYVAAETARKRERIHIIQEVRKIVAETRAAGADVSVSGVPSIVVEMVEAIERDLRRFSLLSVGVIVLFLALVFRRVQWVLLPLLPTGATVVGTMALMRALDKRMTVITANVPSLLVAIGIAHSLHMIVRWRELQVRLADRTRAERAWQLVVELFWPCAFSAATTMVGFASLYFAGSRPIIDFSLLMTFGTGLALILSFIIFPGALAVLPELQEGRLEKSARFLEWGARLSLRRPWVVGLVSVALAAWGTLGILRLDVEARFIDYFRAGTPIHTGLTAIDDRLGGTSGLEVVLTGAPGAFGPRNPENLEAAAGVEAWLRDRLARRDAAGAVVEPGVVMGFTGILDELRKLRPEIKRPQAAFMLNQLVSSGLFDRRTLDDYVVLAPTTVEGREVGPYSVVRVVARVRETDPALRRIPLLREIQAELARRFPAGGPVQAEVTGMFVLYANMLESLAGSQVETSVLCLLAVAVMLAGLFRHLGVGPLALLPNLLPIALALGAMGWGGVPLDMATVMIASVSLGIGVDCAIHYLFRYRAIELPKDGEVGPALIRTSGSIGTSIFYTSVTSIVGFAALAVSEFRPNAYFGILTGLAMVAALFAMLTLLPTLVWAVGLFAPRRAPG